MSELRKHTRIPVNIPCRLTCAGQPAPIDATIRNVSFGGVGAVLKQELPPGTMVELPHRTFPCLPESQTTSQCRVVSTRPSKFGGGDFNISMAFDPAAHDFISKVLQWAQTLALAKKRDLQRTGPKEYF